MKQSYEIKVLMKKYFALEQLEKYTFLKVITLVTAKLTVGIAFSVIMFQSTELFPTNIRHNI